MEMRRQGEYDICAMLRDLTGFNFGFARAKGKGTKHSRPYVRFLGRSLKNLHLDPGRASWTRILDDGPLVAIDRIVAPMGVYLARIILRGGRNARADR